MIKVKKKIFRVNREKAVRMAMKCNHVDEETALRYTDSELKECLKLMGGYTFSYRGTF